MPEIIITCAQCQRQLRVPDEMRGRLVKCPACEFTFTVPRESNGIPPSAPEPLAVLSPQLDGPPPRPRSAEPEWDDRDRLRSSVTAPGICLLITGILGLAGSGLMTLFLTVMHDEVKAQMIADFKRQGRQADINQIEPAMMLLRVVHVPSVLISALVILASVQMLRLRTHWFAVTGSILAIINLGCGCFLLGIPFGIWSLVILFRPEIRNIFYS